MSNNQKHLTTRVPEDIFEEIEKVQEEEQSDRSTVVKKLIESGLEDWKIKKAVEKYEEGRIS
ncbi:MAG: hypothetical protein SXQ77_09905 [Halobacteria archaeon]|nr:hypothetical protein [Halobacteria archaeon]